MPKKKKIKLEKITPFFKIQPGTRITLKKSVPDDYMSNIGVKRIVEKIEDKEKIVFIEHNSEMGFLRHPDFLNQHLKIEILTQTDELCEYKIVYGKDLYDIYLIEF